MHTEKKSFKLFSCIKNYFQKIFLYKSTVILMLLSVFAVFLSVARVCVTGRGMYLFMLTNLLLAFIPWLVASFVYVNDVQNKIVLIGMMLLWLLFFPNAPYMLTDLIHLGKDKSAPLWYDLIMLLTYGFTGLFYGFVSLKMMEEKICSSFKFNSIKILSCVLIYLSCFGVYLGRFLRWNSWNIFNDFASLMSDVLVRMILPFEYRRTWAFTFIAGTFLNLVYLLFRSSALQVKEKKIKNLLKDNFLS